MTTFASRLKSAMGGLTQKELSEQSGISRPTISQYLSGVNTPKRERMAKLAEALKVSIDYLDGTEENLKEPEIVERRIGIAETAACLGKRQQFVRVGLQTGRLPFGSAVQKPDGRWMYYINPVKFRDYVTPEIFDRYFEMA